MGLKLVHKPNRGQVLTQRKAPSGQKAMGIYQVEVSHTSVVVVAQFQTVSKSPMLPGAFASIAAEQALVGDHYQTTNKIQTGVKVNLQRCQNVLLCFELGFHIAKPGSRQFAWQRRLNRYSKGHLVEKIV